MIQIKIILQNKYFILLYKPTGWTVYKESGVELNCVSFLKSKIQAPCFPVHRLDRATCGLVVFAKDPNAAARLSKLFSTHKVQKKYNALVHGAIQNGGKFTNPIGKRGEPIKKATTLFKFKKKYIVNEQVYSLVELTPLTGRFHQLRKHLSLNGYPIVGDPVYGKKEEVFFNNKKNQRLMLSAIGLKFLDPWSRKEFQYNCQPGFMSHLTHKDDSR